MIRAAAIAAAASIIAAAWWWRRQAEPELASAADAGDASWDAPGQPTIADEAMAAMATVRNAIAPTSAAGMHTSATGLAHLQAFERLSLTPYELGDGGWTIGWGRFFPYTGPKPPDAIDRATADAWFAEDVDAKAERWVRAFVTADLTQPQFDALVSMAFNLSPKSFRTIAEAVNRGEDPEAAALQFVRAGTGLERGLRRRRAAELAMYRADPGSYTA